MSAVSSSRKRNRVLQSTVNLATSKKLLNSFPEMMVSGHGFLKKTTASLFWVGRIIWCSAPLFNLFPPPGSKKSRKGMGISVVYLSFFFFYLPSVSWKGNSWGFPYLGIGDYAASIKYGAFARLFQSRGWVIIKFCAARGSGICQPRGHPRAFDTHVVSYPHIALYQTLYRGFY